MTVCTLITTIDLKERSFQILKRTILLICFIKKHKDFTLIISIGHINYFFKKIIELFISDNIELIKSSEYNFKTINNSFLRNKALHKVKTEYAVIVDIDIYVNNEFLNFIREKIDIKSKFDMLPCFYLRDNVFFISKKYHLIYKDFLTYKRKYVLHVAMPSSVILFRIKSALKIGGFNEAYEGNGYEDFDFITRLCLHENIITISEAWLIDLPYDAPLLSKGFRSYLAQLCLENFLQCNFVVHIYHKKGAFYKRNREKNARIYINFLSNWITNNQYIVNKKYSEVDLILYFFNLCEKLNFNPNEYFCLFDARPRYIIKK